MEIKIKVWVQVVMFDAAAATSFVPGAPVKVSKWLMTRRSWQTCFHLLIQSDHRKSVQIHLQTKTVGFSRFSSYVNFSAKKWIVFMFSFQRVSMYLNHLFLATAFDATTEVRD